MRVALLLLPGLLAVPGLEARQDAAFSLAPGDEWVVELLTVGPGPEVWERWGHNMVVISNRLTGTSTSWNWGLFDFQQDDFLLRFVRGRMWYAMGGRPTEKDIALYRRRDRSMTLQRLRVSPVAALALRDSLLALDTDARRNYFYDYYRDNCSTRVRDALDHALGGALRRQFADAPSELTWRWETRRITSPDLPLYSGILLGEGRPVDEGMTRWEQFFLPLRLEEALREVQVRDHPGADGPLVVAERIIHQSTRYTDPVAPRPTWPWLAGLGLLLGSVLYRLANAARRPSRAGRVGFGLLAVGWSLLAGLGSMVLLGLWFLTDHWVTRYNENLLLLTPLSLVLVMGIPLALRGNQRWYGMAMKAATGAVVLAGVALLLKLLPGAGQTNGELIALILPIHGGLCLGLARINGLPAFESNQK